MAENVLIQQALGHSLKHLSICEFMELIKFEKNNVMTDYFWQVMVEKAVYTLGYTTNEVFGYEGEIRSQQQSMKKFLNLTAFNFRDPFK